MRREVKFRRGLLIGMVLGFALGATAGAKAGGSFDDHDDQNAETGPSYFGFVKDTRGAVVPQAQVKAEIKSRGTLFTHTNILGAYKINSFNIAINPDDITISCSKDGYKQVGVVQRPLSGGESGIEIECTLQRL